MRERFEPFSHLLMIGCFFGANLMLLRGIIFSSIPLDTFRISVAFVISLLFFFHLRLFDEIKDYETDLKVNKDRPLPRGLIRMSEFKSVLACVLLLELALSTLLGLEATFALLIPWIYSILMFKEFFIGSWLRPKMEAYAISHTFVSGLLALFWGVVVSGGPVAFLGLPILWVLFNNWMIFNTFEFARKTFAVDEERAHVESYSKRWSPIGAVLWVVFFTSMSALLLWKLNEIQGWGNGYLLVVAVVTAVLMLTAFVYAIQPKPIFARLFRGAASAYLIALNLVIIIFATPYLT